MITPDLFRSRLDSMIDLHHPLAVLATRMGWDEIEMQLAPAFVRQARPNRVEADADLLGEASVVSGGVSAAGRPRLPIRLMASLLYLKHAYDLSDEALVERWSENVVWQFFSGMTYYEPRLPCDATQLGRFRRVLGEAGVEELLSKTIETAVAIEAIEASKFAQVLVDTTVQEKAVAYPTDSRLLEVARAKVVLLAQRAGIPLKQTFAKEGKGLRWRAGGYAHAKQFKRLRRVLKRQRTILGRLLREVQRKLADLPEAMQSSMQVWLERAERIRTQRPKDKGKLYALHAPEVECIGKGKARQPYEFGVKVSVAVTAQQGLMVGARSFPGTPYDGHTLVEQLEQTRILLEGVEGAQVHTVSADLGFRGVDAQIAPTLLVHRGKAKTLSDEQRALLKRRAAVEPAMGIPSTITACVAAGSKAPKAMRCMRCCARPATTFAGCCGPSPV